MAQAVIELIPNFVRVIADDTAGTSGIQWWNGAQWVNLVQFTNDTQAGSFPGPMTVDGAVTFKNALSVGGTATVSGDTSLGGTLSVSGTTSLRSTLATVGAISDNETLQSQAGETAGTIYWSMPMQGTSWKLVAVYLDAYENDTTTANTITFPTAFAYTPYLDNVVGVAGTTVSTTALSIDPDNTTTYTGWIFVYGF